jgi:hypothetical protein
MSWINPKKSGTAKDKTDLIVQFLTGSVEPKAEPKVYTVHNEKDNEFKVNDKILTFDEYKQWLSTLRSTDTVICNWKQGNKPVEEIPTEALVLNETRAVVVAPGCEVNGYRPIVFVEDERFDTPYEPKVTTSTAKVIKPAKQAKKSFKQRLKDTVASIVDSKEKEAPVIDMKKDEIPYEVRRTRRVRFVDPASFGNDPTRTWLY